MRRSLLFIPGNSPAMIQNADIFVGDSVIFDLEDSVIESEKDAARILVSNYLKVAFLPCEVIIRINELNNGIGLQDLDEIISDKIDTIMFPKASKVDLESLDQILTNLENSRKLKKKIGIIPIIELASSLIDIVEITRCNRVNGLLLGAEDLTTDLETERTELGNEIFFARNALIVAAKASKVDAIDTPYTLTNDDDGLRKDATFAKSLGMNAKACIHPNQIDIVNEIFSPSEKEIQFAQKILIAEQESLKQKKGAFSVDGKMIDKPILDRAHKIIEKAKKWNLI